MKKSICVALAVVVICAFGFPMASVSAAEPKAKELDIPGSAVMPPRTIDSPMPPPSVKQKAGAKVGVWINEDGSVDSVEFINGSKEWREPVIETVKKWRFEPVVFEGKALPARTEISFRQSDPQNISSSMSPLPNLPGELHTENELGITKPLIEQDPDLVLPLAARALGRSIEAALRYVVEEDGTTGRFEILGATSEGAVRAALDLVAHRQYQPAKIRERAVAYEYRQQLVFHGLDGAIAALKGAITVVEPVFPFERALAQEEGFALVRFKLDTSGGVISTEMVEASHPDFGGALVAAVEGWTFSLASAAEQDVREYRHDFAFVNTPYASRRLMDMAREKKAISASSAGLDAKPKMLARPALVYPTALNSENVSGVAKIEFVIDRVGLAQVPRVLETSRPELGWAAVTMINGMRFKPVTRDGKPAELRVIMPVSFDPPKAAEAPAKP